MKTEKGKKVFMASAIGNSLGFTAGLIYAFKKQKSFWGYVGYGLLFSIIGGTATGVPAYFLVKDGATGSKTTDESDAMNEKALKEKAEETKSQKAMADKAISKPRN